MRNKKQSLTKRLFSAVLDQSATKDHKRMVLVIDYLSYRLKRERMIAGIPSQWLPLRNRNILPNILIIN